MFFFKREQFLQVLFSLALTVLCFLPVAVCFLYLFFSSLCVSVQVGRPSFRIVWFDSRDRSPNGLIGSGREPFFHTLF